MSLLDLIVVTVTDTIDTLVSKIAKKYGQTKVKTKQIESYLFWFIFLSFIILLCYVTFKYS